jgi:hypothetical protein
MATTKWTVRVTYNSDGVVTVVSADDGLGFSYTTSRPADPAVAWSMDLSGGAPVFVSAAIAARNQNKIQKTTRASVAALIEEQFRIEDV